MRLAVRSRNEIFFGLALRRTSRRRRAAPRRCPALSSSSPNNNGLYSSNDHSRNVYTSLYFIREIFLSARHCSYVPRVISRTAVFAFYPCTLMNPIVFQERLTDDIDNRKHSTSEEEKYRGNHPRIMKHERASPYERGMPSVASAVAGMRWMDTGVTIPARYSKASVQSTDTVMAQVDNDGHERQRPPPPPSLPPSLPAALLLKPEIE